MADAEQPTTDSGVAPSLGETNDVHAPAENWLIAEDGVVQV